MVAAVANISVLAAFAGGTTPAADTCGYPTPHAAPTPPTSTRSATAFTESTVMRTVQVFGSGSSAHIGGFANDEKGLLLGVKTPTSSTPTPFTSAGSTTLAAAGALTINVTYTSISVNATQAPFATNDTLTLNNGASPAKTQSVKVAAPGAPAGATTIPVVSFKANANYPTGSSVSDTNVAYGSAAGPDLGDTTATDATLGGTADRPLYPALYITDVTGKTTADPTFYAHDWQQGGTPHTGIDNLYGSWTTASTTSGSYVDTFPPSQNHWNLGPNADTPSGGFAALGDEGYGAEVVWNVSSLPGLTPGNTYRLQVIEHDGDQNKTGGDVGEFCTTLTIPGPPIIKTSPDANSSPSSTFALKVPKGSSIFDVAAVSGPLGVPSGTFTFNLYFVPAPVTDPCNGLTATDLSQSLTAVQTQTMTLDSNGKATSSPSYDTSAHGFGTYYWQGVYTPDASSPYTGGREDCGAETVQIVDARVQITPQSKTNIVNNAHLLTATLQQTIDGTNWTAVASAGNTISFSFVVPPAVSAVFTGNPAVTSCTTTASGSCGVSINDSVPELVTVRASSTNFNVPGVTGTFTRATGGTGCSTGTDATCDAQKTYISPTTVLTVSDTLTGLTAGATGTVTYTAYKTPADCANGTGGVDETPSPNTVSGDSAPTSNSVVVGPGTTFGTSVWFTATYSGNEGSFTSSCTEKASST